MALIIFSQSRSFEAHIRQVLDGEFSLRSALSPPGATAGNVYLVHAASYPRQLADWLRSAVAKGAVVGIADDQPTVQSMLGYTETGARGCFNSYMSGSHYSQMLRLLANGQSWFPPTLLAEAFELARSVVRPTPSEDPLRVLTRREREVALAVAEGKTNRRVASDCNISERTVKTHLTQIFKKLQVSDRVALVIYINQFESFSSDPTTSARSQAKP